jgi:flagellar hook-associated protein 3 FlgL
MRVSNYENYDKTVYAINITQRTMAIKQQQIASGKAFDKVSEDPLRANQLSLVQKSYNRLEQFQRNITDAKGFLTQVETTMGNAVSILQDTRDKALLAKNGTASAEDVQTYLMAINNNIEQMVNYGNTQVLGRYIFAGQQTQTVPFNYDGSTVTYSGDSQPLTYNISDTSTVNITSPGDQSFLGMINAMINLRDQISLGNQTGMGTALGGFDVEMNKVIDLRSEMGTRLNAIDALNEGYETSKTNLDAQKEIVGGIDYVQVITELEKAQQAYQATIQAAVKVNEVSILNYM